MKESASEKAIKYMQKFHDRDSDYFQSKYHQREARQGFIDLYKLDQKKGEDIWNHTFPKFLRKNKLKKDDFIKTRFRRPVSDMNATIKPKPQEFIFEKKQVEIVNKEIQQHQSVLPVQEIVQIKNEYIDPVAVESTFEGLWTILKIQWPLEDLTKEELQALGRMWLPIFKRYFSEKWAYIGLPFFAAIGIFGKHIIKARAKRKKREDKEQIELDENYKSSEDQVAKDHVL